MLGPYRACSIPIGRVNTKIEMCGSAICFEGFERSGLDSMLTG